MLLDLYAKMMYNFDKGFGPQEAKKGTHIMPEENNTEYKMNLKQRAENYWYHYKWHTLIALFIVITLSVCILQLCQKNSYDVYVLYAGGGELERTSENGDFPEYQKAVSALGKYAEDFDSDGSVSVGLLTLYVPTEDEISAIESAGENVNYGLIRDNSKALSDNMLHSDYYLCFLSRELFLKYCAEEVGVFEEIADYTAADKSYEYVNEYGILLSSLGVYSRDGIKTLPSDTVVCLRRLGAVSTRFDKKTEKAYENAALLLTELLK